MVNMRLRTCE